MESMVQRVVRQAKETELTNKITLATNASQLDIISNQLDDKVSVVTKSECRDSFPAIALAINYLKLEKKRAVDEVVAIMYCDPYTEAESFHTISRMAQCVEQNVAALVLMGITSTYPSEKFGYIMPTSQVPDGFSEYKMFSGFTEKPTVKKAKELLAEGAFLKGGIFAFRLCNVMNIVRKYMICDNFENTCNRCSVFPKIPFGYEVAEKAESVVVVPYKSEWKDLGTWNTLTDELHISVIDNAVMGRHCENAHVINETQLPIYAEDLKDIIVAACSDGILVCSKERSEEIKKVVENLTPRPMYGEFRWGTYRVLDVSKYVDGSRFLTKIITLKEGKNISYQIHHHRSEVWTSVEGEGIFAMDGVEKRVKAGGTVIKPVGHYHAIKALSQITFIEVQNGHPLVEDVEKFKWN